LCVSSNIRYPQSKSIWCHVWSKLVGSKWKAYGCECNTHRNSKLYGKYHPIDCSLSPQTNSYSNNQELESCREVAVARARASQTTRTFSRQISSQPKQRPHTAPKQLVLSGCRESRPPSVRWGSTWGGACGMRGTLQPLPRARRPPRTTALEGARARARARRECVRACAACIARITTRKPVGKVMESPVGIDTNEASPIMKLTKHVSVPALALRAAPGTLGCSLQPRRPAYIV